VKVPRFTSSGLRLRFFKNCEKSQLKEDRWQSVRAN